MSEILLWKRNAKLEAAIIKRKAILSGKRKVVIDGKHILTALEILNGIEEAERNTKKQKTVGTKNGN
jgi:hypothetical protein